MDGQERTVVRLAYEIIALPRHATQRLLRSIPLIVYPLIAPFAVGQALIMLGSSKGQEDPQPTDWFGALRCAASFIHHSNGGWIVLGTTAGLTLMATRRIAIRSPVGPIEIGDVNAEPRGDAGETMQADVLAVAAVLKDRLARSTVPDQGAVPGYGDLDVGTESTLTSPLAVSGFLARMGLGLLQQSVSRLGWRVHVTLRHSAVTGEFGLTYDVEHVATRRSDVVHTVWAVSWIEAARVAAYEIAAWQRQRVTPASSRHRPTWRPSGKALRAYEETRFFGAARRYDEAISAAIVGLGLDPSSLPLRQELGEIYERIGHFMAALHTYAAGLVLLRDRDNGWSVTKTRSEASWPPGRLRRLSSIEAAGILWRYIAVLSFADQWVDRWIAEIERLEAEAHLERCARCRSDRACREQVSGPSAFCRRAKPLKEQLLPWPDSHARGEGEIGSHYDRELADRAEQARRLRGFFARRYASLLKAEYPLLKMSLFDEAVDRNKGLPLAGPGTGFAWRKPADIDSRFPLDSWGLQPQPPPWTTAVTSRPAWHQRVDDPNGVDVLVAAVSALRTLADTFATVKTAIGAELPDLQRLVEPLRATRRPAHFEHASSPSRQEVISMAGHLSTMALDALPPAGASGKGATTSAVAAALSDVATFRASIDLRAFFQRTVMLEIQWLRDKREAEIAPVVSPRLWRMMWLGARYRFQQRTSQLAHHLPTGGAGSDQADPGGARTDLWEATAAEVRRITGGGAGRLESWRARTFGSPGEWNLWYYSACLMGILMDPMPTPSNRSPLDALDPLVKWIRNNDSRAEQAVWALDQAVLVRRSGGKSAVEAGVTGWLLFEDPDLELLRDHPRFYRWASATMGVEVVDTKPTQRQEMAQDEPRHHRFTCCRGSFGIEGTWGRSQKLWRYSNDLALRHLLRGGSELVLSDLHVLRRRLEAPDGADHVSDLRRRLTSEHEFWTTLACADRFASRPDLRLRLQRVLRDLAPESVVSGMAFPTVAEVLTGIGELRGRHVQIGYSTLRSKIDELHSQAVQAKRRFADVEPLLRSVRSGTWATPYLDEAVGRWTRLNELAVCDLSDEWVDRAAARPERQP